MTTIRLCVPSELINYLRDNYQEKIKNEFKINPSDSFLIKLPYYIILSYEKNKEIEIKFNKSNKKLEIHLI